MLIIGSLDMEYPIIVGAGVCKHPESMGHYMRPDAPIGAIVTGSYTPLARDGNQGAIAWPATMSGLLSHGVGLNAMGMPNVGNTVAAKALSAQAKQHNKPCIVSVAGFNAQDYLSGLATFSATAGVNAIELNLGCPNVQDQHPVPIACSIDRTCEILSAVGDTKPVLPIWVKMSPCLTAEALQELKNQHPDLDFSNVPTFEKGFYQEVLRLVVGYPFVKAVVLNNTLPNVRRIEDGKPVTDPNEGKAGMSGSAMFKTTRMSVIEAKWLTDEVGVDIIACGGILNGDDAAEVLNLGAAAVACTSGPYWTGGPRFFAELLQRSKKLQDYLSSRL